MVKLNRILTWLKKEFDQMSFYSLMGYLFVAFYVVFIETEITNSFFDALINVFFEMTGILALIELLKRLFPNFDWDKNKEGKP